MLFAVAIIYSISAFVGGAFYDFCEAAIRWVVLGDELYTLGLRTLQSEDFSKMRSVVCATKQIYIRDFEASYKNVPSGKKKKRTVLDISDLMVPQGSVVGVIGNNGAGKTSFAHNLCGLLQTAKGSMSMDGKTYMAKQRIKACYMVRVSRNRLKKFFAFEDG